MTGPILEFGCWSGFTSKILAELINQFGFKGKLYLYDSFKGLPKIETDVDRQSYEGQQGWKQGRMAVDRSVVEGIQEMHTRLLGRDRFEVIEGFYSETVPARLPQERVALVHLDCDLYVSAKWVLDNLIGRSLLQDGCLLLFDDFNCNRANPKMGERRALHEAFAGQDRFS